MPALESLARLMVPVRRTFWKRPELGIPVAHAIEIMGANVHSASEMAAHFKLARNHLGDQFRTVPYTERQLVALREEAVLTPHFCSFEQIAQVMHPDFLHVSNRVYTDALDHVALSTFVQPRYRLVLKDVDSGSVRRARFKARKVGLTEEVASATLCLTAVVLESLFNEMPAERTRQVALKTRSGDTAVVGPSAHGGIQVELARKYANFPPAIAFT